MNFTFSSSTHGTFSRIDHILGHKASLGKFKKIEIIPSIFSDHNAIRLDLNYRRKLLKIPTYGGWTTCCWITNYRRNQNMHRNEWKWKHNNPKPVGHCKSKAKGMVHSNTGILKKQEKSQINNLTLHLKQLEKEEMKNSRVNREKSQKLEQK